MTPWAVAGKGADLWIRPDRFSDDQSFTEEGERRRTRSTIFVRSMKLTTGKFMEPVSKWKKGIPTEEEIFSIVAGVLVTVFVSAAWVGATHLFKDLFLRRYPPRPLHSFPATTHVGEPPNLDGEVWTRALEAPPPHDDPVMPGTSHIDEDAADTTTQSSNDTTSPQQARDSVMSFFSFGFAPANEYVPYGRQPGAEAVFDAPLFTTWFCTAWTSLFFPLYLMCRSCSCRGRTPVSSSLKSVSSAFRDRGVTCSKLLSRCCLFSVLWVATHYMYIYSLRILDCTDVMALYSAHVAFVYLLAWVILHEQFVGVRIVAVIMCNTGIALLAYMDGITHTTTLAGVVLAAASAAGSAVYKVSISSGAGSVGRSGSAVSAVYKVSISSGAGSAGRSGSAGNAGWGVSAKDINKDNHQNPSTTEQGSSRGLTSVQHLDSSAELDFTAQAFKYFSQSFKRSSPTLPYSTPVTGENADVMSKGAVVTVLWPCCSAGAVAMLQCSFTEYSIVSKFSYRRNIAVSSKIHVDDVLDAASYCDALSPADRLLFHYKTELSSCKQFDLSTFMHFMQKNYNIFTNTRLR
ncbi:hypothetical protein FHG87_005367 [Trinorchestia longiramus]|nr:hypothetical protein FHG87_005367 [Trinorchestia longiramus]